MRVVLDVNLFISYLLIPFGRRNPTIIDDAVFSGAFTLLVSDQLLWELTQRVVTKPYLAQRIDRADVEGLAVALRTVAEVMPGSADPIPARSRDRKDDYLLAQAISARADVLVTGDDDLLSLEDADGLKIVSPADFVRMLEGMELA